ncbi:TrbC/VIRB2 family protein [compost metagenome]
MYTKLMKIAVTVSICLSIVLTGMNITYAALSPKNLTANYQNTTEIQTVGEKVMGIIQTVGVVTAVIILMVLGIKYMMGSAEEKAEYKKTMMPYVIGAILIFGATAIANMVYNFANGLN